jgi:hypothetical protein
VGSSGISTNTAKISAVKQLAAPSNIKQLRVLLGLTGYYRCFVKNFANVAVKNATCMWSCECLLAFEQLKALLTSSEILAYPEEQYPKKLNVDVSGHALGGVLVQVYPDGSARPIGYFSHILLGAELYYHTPETECLAIIEFIKHFKPYLYGKLFIVESDHKALTSMKVVTMQGDPQG